MLGTVYLPPKNSSYIKQNGLDNINVLEMEIMKFKKEAKLLICGDLNARTSTLPDHISNDSLDTYIPLPRQYNCDVEMRNRNNMDKKTNDFGKSIIDICIGNNLCLINGRVQGDFLGNVTCIKTAGVSTVDYNIISKDIFHMVKSLIVLPLTIYSDHRPLSLELYIIYKPTPTSCIEGSPCPPKYLFDKRSIEPYKTALCTEECMSHISQFNSTLFCKDQDGIDKSIEGLSNIVKNAASKSLHLVKIKKRKIRHQPWYTKTCSDLKCTLSYLKGIHDKFPLNRKFREDYYSCRSRYRSLLKQCEAKYNRYYSKLIKNKKQQSKRFLDRAQ